jgi:RecA/RadA recombinase
MSKEKKNGLLTKFISSLPTENKTHIPTGCFTLDMVLCGGITEGTVTVVSGESGSYKSGVTRALVKNYQDKYPERHIIIFDTEQAFSREYYIEAGIRNVFNGREEEMEEGYGWVIPQILNNSECIEEVLTSVLPESPEIYENLGLLVIDSISAIRSSKELDAEIGKTTVAPRAMAVSKLCYWPGIVNSAKPEGAFKITTVWTSHLRLKQIGGVSFGDPVTEDIPTKGGYLAHTVIRLKSLKDPAKQHLSSKTAQADSAMITGGFSVKKIRQDSKELIAEFAIQRNGDDKNTFYNALSVFSRAREFGFLGGQGKTPIHYPNLSFKLIEETKAWLEDTPEILKFYYNLCIAKVREELGMPATPSDNYILGEYTETPPPYSPTAKKSDTPKKTLEDFLDKPTTSTSKMKQFVPRAIAEAEEEPKARKFSSTEEMEQYMEEEAARVRQQSEN